MQIKTSVATAAVAAAISVTVISLYAQAPQTPGAPQTPAVSPQPPQAAGGRGGGRAAGGGRPAAYPDRPPADPAVVERGKSLYGVNCNFCHGSDARGGEGGPNLLRSDLVLNDQHGELITPVVQKGRGEMPALNLTAPQVSDVAAYIHSFKVGGYDISRNVPLTILVGDAKAGEAYFQTTCASCHSVTADLKGIAGKYPDPKALQNFWMMPGGRGGRGGGGVGAASPTTVTVTVTMPSGQKLEGRLGRIDDFLVTLTEPDGTPHTIRRDGDSPKVEVHDPLLPHKELLRKYSDKDIHNLTAYLVTVK